MQVLARQSSTHSMRPIPRSSAIGRGRGIRDPERPFGVDEPLVIEGTEARGGRQPDILLVPGVWRLRARLGQPSPLAEHLLDHGTTFRPWPLPPGARAPRGDSAGALGPGASGTAAGWSSDSVDAAGQRAAAGTVGSPTGRASSRGRRRRDGRCAPDRRRWAACPGSGDRSVTGRRRIAAAGMSISSKPVAEVTLEVPVACRHRGRRAMSCDRSSSTASSSITRSIIRPGAARFRKRLSALVDRRPQRLVVQVEHPPPMQLAGRDRRRQPAVDERA